MNTENPNKLRLIDGQLVCVDGSDIAEYLRTWAEDVGVEPYTPINLIRSDGLKKLRDDSWMYRNHAA